MPLHRHLEDGLRFAPTADATVRFTMASEGRPVTTDLPLSVMRAAFGSSRLELLADLATLREVIEATASQVYDTAVSPGVAVVLADASFDTEASRTDLQTEGKA